MGLVKNVQRADHIYTLHTLIKTRKSRKHSPFVCFIDARKAFDTVRRDFLWYKLYKCGFGGNITSSIISLYDNVKCSVKINGKLSP